MENGVMVEFQKDDCRFEDLFEGGLLAGEYELNAVDLDVTDANYTIIRKEGCSMENN